MTQYAVVYEREGRSFGAYVPALPGCVALGSTLAIVERRIAEAIELHVEALREAGEPVPRERNWTGIVYVDIDAEGDVRVRSGRPSAQKPRIATASHAYSTRGFATALGAHKKAAGRRTKAATARRKTRR